jgi:mandelate racemase
MRVVARGLSLTPSRPVETAAGVLRSTPLVLIDLTTDDGVVGRSYLRCYSELVLGALVRLVNDLGTVPAERLPAELKLIGTRGLVGHALAGLDMARWDARAKAEGVPLATLLGGSPKPIRAYASLRTMSPGPAASEASLLVQQGFTAVKVKVGRGDLDDDLATLRAVRSAAGPDVGIMADYNQSLTVPEAIRRAQVLDDLGLTWIEEPTAAEDFAGHAEIAAAARTPIQLGENWLGPDEAAAAITAKACDDLTFDAMKIGGVTGWRRAAEMASRAGLGVSSHTFIEFSAHLLAVTPTAGWLEYLDHAGEILREPLVVRDGFAFPSTTPGAGLEWKEPYSIG